MGAHGISTISFAFRRTAAHLAYLVRVLKMQTYLIMAAKNIYIKVSKMCLLFSTWFYLSSPLLSCSVFRLHCGRQDLYLQHAESSSPTTD